MATECASPVGRHFRGFPPDGVNVSSPITPATPMSEGSPERARLLCRGGCAYDYLMSRDDLDRPPDCRAGFRSAAAQRSISPAESASRGDLDRSYRQHSCGRLRRFVVVICVWAVSLAGAVCAFDNLAKILRVRARSCSSKPKRDQLTSAGGQMKLAAAVTAKMVRVVVDADHDGAWKMGRKRSRVGFIRISDRSISLKN